MLTSERDSHFQYDSSSMSASVSELGEKCHIYIYLPQQNGQAKREIHGLADDLSLHGTRARESDNFRS